MAGRLLVNPPHDALGFIQIVFPLKRFLLSPKLFSTYSYPPQVYKYILLPPMRVFALFNRSDDISITSTSSQLIATTQLFKNPGHPRFLHNQ